MRNSDGNLAVVIVNFNAGQFLLECLSSLEKASLKLNLDIWLVDNASTDGSIEEAQRRFPKLKFIKNPKNLGFGKANNQALREVKNEFILLLNPDCEVSAETLEYMLNFMHSNPQVGAATCKVENSDESIDWASHRGFPTPWASFLYFALGNDSLYHQTYQDMAKTHEVDSISGAFFMTKKSVLEKVGFFDEDYFLYAEDLDLCFRIREKGFKIMYVPDVVVLHHKGITSGIKSHSKDISLAEVTSRRRALNSFHETMEIFYKKHLEKKYPFFINWLVYLGIKLRWFLAGQQMKV